MCPNSIILINVFIFSICITARPDLEAHFRVKYLFERLLNTISNIRYKQICHLTGNPNPFSVKQTNKKTKETRTTRAIAIASLRNLSIFYEPNQATRAIQTVAENHSQIKRVSARTIRLFVGSVWARFKGKIGEFYSRPQLFPIFQVESKR
jgi:hypothetical protein